MHSDPAKSRVRVHHQRKALQPKVLNWQQTKSNDIWEIHQKMLWCKSQTANRSSNSSRMLVGTSRNLITLCSKALGLPVWLAASCTFSQKWLINLFINLKLVNSFVASLTLICTLPRSNHTRWKSSQPLQKTIASKISLSLFPHLSSIVLLRILKSLYLHHGLRPDSLCNDSVSPTYLVFLWRSYLLKHLYTVLLSSWHYW